MLTQSLFISLKRALHQNVSSIQELKIKYNGHQKLYLYSSNRIMFDYLIPIDFQPSSYNIMTIYANLRNDKL